MKKAKLTTWILAALLCGSTVLAGCSKTEEPEETEAVEETSVVGEVEVVEEVEEEETLQEIGDPAASIEILLANKMGSAITGMSIKSPQEEEFPDNMMTADQKIEDDETVKLFYEPVAKEDVVPEEEEAVKPDSSYVGFWNEAGEDDLELTIYDVSDDTVTFHMWLYHSASTDDSVVATLDSENVGTFSTSINGGRTVTGTILFYDDAVVLNFDERDDEQFPTGTYVFNERHDTSWEEGESYTLEGQEDADSDSEEDIDADSTYTLQVTMENGDVYELHYFDVEDMEEVTLYLEDDVAFIEYMSLSQNVLINTKEKELKLKEDGEEVNEDTERDEEAYQAGYYCGENAYSKEDAEDRAAELGYASGSSSYQDFWDGYNDGYYDPYRTDGDNYAYGYSLGLAGYTEEEAQADFTSDGSTYDPKSQYVKDFWNGYYKGYSEYEEVQSIYYSDSYQMGLYQGQLGHSLDEAESVLRDYFGSNDYSPYYQNFLDGYYEGLSEYEEQNSQAEADWKEDDYYDAEGEEE